MGYEKNNIILWDVHSIYHIRLKTNVEKISGRKETNEISKKQVIFKYLGLDIFMRVLKYLISSMKGNKRKLLWVLPFRNKVAFPCDWNIRRKMGQVPSKLFAILVCNILKESDLSWWVIKEKLKDSLPRGFYMQNLRNPLKSISLKGKLIKSFMIN